MGAVWIREYRSWMCCFLDGVRPPACATVCVHSLLLTTGLELWAMSIARIQYALFMGSDS